MSPIPPQIIPIKQATGHHPRVKVERCGDIITLTTKTFNYSFETIATVNGAVHALKHQTLPSDYSQLLQLQSLMANQRKHLEHHAMVTSEAEEQAWGERLESEIANLQTRLHEWLWELEGIDQNICLHTLNT
ncbi:MAG: hypothetical protein Q9199_002732 [Rusavskia elegans]